MGTCKNTLGTWGKLMGTCEKVGNLGHINGKHVKTHWELGGTLMGNM
jgi:hypothetical protein